jgi:hypothetical protein
MLFQNQINPGVMLAENLDGQGFYIAAEPGTPLSALVGTMNLSQGEVMPPATPSDYTPNTKFYQDQSSAFGAGLRGYEVPHSEKLDELGLQISKFVRNHLAFAKTTVREVALELCENYGRYAKEYRIDPTAKMRVEVVDLPGPCNDSEILDFIKDLKGKPQGAPIITLSFLDPLSPMEIRSLASKSYASPSLSVWLGGLSDAFLSEVYGVVLCKAKPRNGLNFQNMKMAVNGADVCLLVALLAGGVYDNPPDGTGVGISEYNTSLSTLRNQACLRLSYLIDEYRAKADMGYLVLSNTNDTVFVLGDVYRKWRNEAGNDQLIIASVLMREPVRTVHNIEEVRSKLEGRYATYLAATRMSMDANRAVILRGILRDQALKLVSEKAKAIYANCTNTALWGDGFIDPRLGEFDKFKLMLDDYCANASAEKLDDVWRVALDVTCDCIFNFAESAGLILRGIERYTAQNPNLPVNEAAALSAADYVFRYLCDQLQIRRITS